MSCSPAAANPLRQRKVACFVTRSAGETSEVLVFWHPGGGLQIPAGTVEDDESFLDAAWREVAEETGLADLDLVAQLGVVTSESASGRAFVVRPLELRTSPSGPVTSWRVGRSEVETVEQSGDWTRVVYSERDLDSPSDGIVFARLEGWAPTSHLSNWQDRAFFHFHAPVGTPSAWEQQAEPDHRFHLRWHSVTPPPALVSEQATWLENFRSLLG